MLCRCVIYVILQMCMKKFKVKLDSLKGDECPAICSCDPDLRHIKLKCKHVRGIILTFV